MVTPAHPAAMIHGYDEVEKKGTEDFLVMVGNDPAYGSNNAEEAFRVFAYLAKHRELTEDEEGELLSLRLVANDESVVVAED